MKSRLNTVFFAAVPWHQDPVYMALLGVVVVGAVYLLGVFGSRYNRQRRAAARREQEQDTLHAVREQVWKMQDAEDIGQVLGAVSSGLKTVAFPSTYFGVNFIDPQVEQETIAYTVGPSGKWVRRHLKTARLIWEIWSGKNVAYRPDLDREDLYKERAGGLGASVRSVVDVPFSHGTLAASSTMPEAFSPQDIDFLTAMAQVLSEGFRRMEDLQVLGQRNQELEREIVERRRREKRRQAIYRVRERVWLMQRVDDIESVMEAVGTGLKAMGVAFRYYGVNIVDKTGEPQTITYALDREGTWFLRGVGSMGPSLIWQFWHAKETVYRQDLHKEDPYDERKYMDPYGIRAVVDVPFTHGSLAASSTEPNAFSAEDLDVLEDMAVVLSEGFQRMDDLKTLAQRNDELEAEIAERKQTEAELHVAKDAAEAANRAKSIFLANMSHEIRTPMNAILGYAQILDGDPNLHPNHRQAVKTIRTSGQHLLGLINDVLDISKIEAGNEELHVTDFNLDVLLASLAEMFDMRCQQKNLAWRLELELEDGPVRGDEGKLRQVLINLLSNAVKFTRAGTVTLRVAAAQAGAVRFEVADTGQGIAPGDQKIIFKPFRQAASRALEGGTGLGLAIARQHVELMGGTLELQSTPGQGSRFFFTLDLPAGQGMVRAASRDWAAVQYLAEQYKVYALVVDDVLTNRDILGQLLARIGVEVALADSGEAALEAVRRRRPDIVFLDIRMPVMDGQETLRRLLAEHGQAAPRTVAVTASVFAHQRQDYIAAGFAGFIDKPLQAEQVYACLVELLGVEYVYGEPARPPAPRPGDWAFKDMPVDVLDELRTAVEEHSITRLRKAFDALEDSGPAGRDLGRYMRDLLQHYDMNGIKAVLAKVE